MIDLRSDLCSVPTEEMWEAMRSAELGWATYGEDASVNALCERVAHLLGTAAALWAPTCSLANLAAMLVHCEPGDRVVVEASAHVLTSEEMGIVSIAGLEPRPLRADDGHLDTGLVEELVSSVGARLLVLENTHTRAGGTVLSVSETAELCAVARRQDCAIHLDGARLVNAAVSLGVPLAALAESVSSVAFSLNKGLSAPMGTILAGSDEFVAQARIALRRLGGASVHRAGIPAAAGLVALDTTIHGIADDHRRARGLAELLAAVRGLRLDPVTVETNVVLVDVSETGVASEAFAGLLAAAGVRVLVRDAARIRLVTHRLIGDAEVAEAAAAVALVVDGLREG